MRWKKRKYFGTNKNYSMSRKLRNDNKSNDEFEVMLSALSLEDVIALKLELATKPFGGNCYGIPIWYSTREIVQDAVLKTALSICRSKKEAARFLGLTYGEFKALLKKYNTENFFEKNNENNLTNILL